MCDVDEFKKLNDELGHAAGDDCLVEVARIISSRIRRAVDQVARYGGEEFLVLLPKVTEAEAREIAERIREGVAAAALPNPGSRVLPVVTISVGIAFRPLITRDLTPDQLQSQADAALYAAKRNGRNRVEVYREDVSPAQAAVRHAPLSALPPG